MSIDNDSSTFRLRFELFTNGLRDHQVLSGLRSLADGIPREWVTLPLFTETPPAAADDFSSEEETKTEEVPAFVLTHRAVALRWR